MRDIKILIEFEMRELFIDDAIRALGYSKINKI